MKGSAERFLMRSPEAKVGDRQRSSGLATAYDRIGIER